QPEPPVEAVEKIVGLDADFLDNLLVEIVQELFTRVFLTLGDLGFELALKLVELELDLLGRAALLVDGGDAFLDIDAGVDRAEHLVAGAEHTVEQAELLVEQLVDPDVGGVRLVEEIDDDNIELLAIAVAAADALFDALGFPGKVVIHDEIAELEIDPLG